MKMAEHSKYGVTLIKNSKLLPHDSHETKIKPTFLLVDSSCLDSSMPGTKVVPKKGDKGRTKILWTKAVVYAEE